MYRYLWKQLFSSVYLAEGAWRAEASAATSTINSSWQDRLSLLFLCCCRCLCRRLFPNW